MVYEFNVLMEKVIFINAIYTKLKFIKVFHLLNQLKHQLYWFVFD
jgi:hypothetical protein